MTAAISSHHGGRSAPRCRRRRVDLAPGSVVDGLGQRVDRCFMDVLLRRQNSLGAVDHQREQCKGAFLLSMQGSTNPGALGMLLPQAKARPDRATTGSGHSKGEDQSHEPRKRKFGGSEPHFVGHGSQSPSGDEGAGDQKGRMGSASSKGGREGGGQTFKIPLHRVSGMSLMDLVRPLETKVNMEDQWKHEPAKKSSKPSVSDAIKIAKLKTFGSVVDKFKKRFFSVSSEKSRQCKRTEVMKLARQISGSVRPLPLDKETVEGVAAALKEAGLKSGQQYMTELRLMHIEAGFDVEPWLKRCFDLCKKSLERERGPVTRAAEVKLETIDGSRSNPGRRRQKGQPMSGAKMFLWAAIWMLREIEVRNMKVKDIKLQGDLQVVSIWLPVSKCDQSGAGVRRTLKCRCCGPCMEVCPWKVGNELVTDAKLKGMFADAWLFRDFRGAGTSKSGVVKCWKSLFGLETTGHSPRRSGAMFYVRQGLPIQELAFLGRWKSGVVLQYAEEALQEKPVFIPGNEAPENRHPVKLQVGMPERNVEEDAMNKGIESMVNGDLVDNGIARAFDKPKDLWVVTKGRGGKDRPRHKVTKAAWTLPISSWSTACGWHFAAHSMEFYFVLGSAGDKVKCSKCEAAEKARRVNEVNVGA